MCVALYVVCVVLYVVCVVCVCVCAVCVCVYMCENVKVCVCVYEYVVESEHMRVWVLCGWVCIECAVSVVYLPQYLTLLP